MSRYAHQREPNMRRAVPLVAIATLAMCTYWIILAGWIAWTW